MDTGSNVALLSLIVIVQQSSSFVFAWLCITVFSGVIILVIVRLANQRASVLKQLLIDL